MAAGAMDESIEDTDELLLQFIQEALAAKAGGGCAALYEQLVAEVRRLKAALAGADGEPADGGAGAAEGPDAGAHQHPAPGDQLATLLHALALCVSAAQPRAHEALLAEALDVPLWAAPRPARLAALELVCHLVAARGALVPACLSALAYGLTPPPAPPAPDAAPGERWAPPPAAAQAQDDVVAAAARVLALAPTAAPRLLPLLRAGAPHRLRGRDAHCLYLRALFALAEAPGGAPLREELLAAAVEHAVGLDVEIRWEDIADVGAGAAAEEAAEEVGGADPRAAADEPDIFELEGMTELDLAAGGGAHLDGDACPGRGGWEGGAALAPPPPAAAAAAAPEAAPPPVDETADKLDSVMELLFEHVGRRLAAGQLPAVWATTLAAFERHVLHTHRSKFAQFLVFRVAAAAPEPCARGLLGALLGRLTDGGAPPVTRAAAAAYAGSFLARAAYVPRHVVVEALAAVVDWCCRYARDEGRRGGLPPIPSSAALGGDAGGGGGGAAAADPAARHTAFYAAVQAALYVLCYHSAALLRPRRGAPRAAGAAAGSPAAPAPGAGAASPGGGAPAGGAAAREAAAAAVGRLYAEALPALLGGPLDPVARCAASVAAEFARQARAAGHAELAALVRRRATAARAAGGAHRPLELFFPFDPYLLRRSAAALDLGATYVAWRRGHPAGAAVRGDASSDDGGSDDEELEGGSDGGDAMSHGGVDGDDSASSASSSSDGSSSSSDDEDDSSDDDDDDSGADSSTDSDADLDGLKRTRFGSMPGSSMSSGRGRRRFGKKRRLPAALKASLRASALGGSSPSVGLAFFGHGGAGRGAGGVGAAAHGGAAGGGLGAAAAAVGVPPRPPPPFPPVAG